MRLLAAAGIVLLSASVAAQPATVILVRHAERAAAPAGDPGLTAEGSKRAADLMAVVAAYRVTSVITTHLQRTRLTAKPVTDALGKEPIVVTAGGPTAAHVEAVAAAVRARPAGDVVLVVGHSNTIPAIVTALGGPKLPDLCDTQYSSLFVLQFKSGAEPAYTRTTYGAADPSGSDSCGNRMP